MTCNICGKKARKNEIVCSDKCQVVRLKMAELGRKYFPTNGCDNCWGDLGEGCSSECREEFRKSREFAQEIWSLIRVIYPAPNNKLKDK